MSTAKTTSDTKIDVDIAAGGKVGNDASHAVDDESHDRIAKSAINLCRRRSRPSPVRRQSTLPLFLTQIRSGLPTSPTNRALLLLSALSAGLRRELELQRSLSRPPDVFANLDMNSRTGRIVDRLSRPDGIFERSIVPSLFVGTRGAVSSLVAYILRDDGGGIREREVITVPADGAKIVLDWELPVRTRRPRGVDDSTKASSVSEVSSKDMIRRITRPVVVLVHGMNNDSSFRYIRSMMKTAVSRGWLAVCMNLRGQDGKGELRNTTPRGYNAGYTGDLRAVISHLERRLVTSQHHGTTKLDDADSYIGGPIYLVGYSLGANIITKYLGEESLHGTLPKCIGGGAALGNPLHIASNSIPFPWNMILAMGVKKSVLQNLSVYKKHHDRGFQSAIKKALLSRTIGQVDDAFAPYIVRNEGDPPYTTRVGYSNGKEYWHDSSSHRYVGHVSVPLLKVAARDDFLVFGQFASKLNHCLESPNVVVVKTHCGGHLGWQESPPPAKDSKGKEIPSPWFGANRGSWSDVAVADFIEALLYIREDNRKKDEEVLENAKEARMHKIVSRL